MVLLVIHLLLRGRSRSPSLPMDGVGGEPELETAHFLARRRPGWYRSSARRAQCG